MQVSAIDNFIIVWEDNATYLYSQFSCDHSIVFMKDTTHTVLFAGEFRILTVMVRAEMLFMQLCN